MGRAHSALSQTLKSWNHPAAHKPAPGPHPGPGPWCPRPLMQQRGCKMGEPVREAAPGLASRATSPRPQVLAVGLEGGGFRSSQQAPCVPTSIGGRGLDPEVAERPGLCSETQPLPHHPSLPPRSTSPPPLTSSSDTASATHWGGPSPVCVWGLPLPL